MSETITSKDFDKYIDKLFQPLLDKAKDGLEGQYWLDHRDNIIIMKNKLIQSAKEEQKEKDVAIAKSKMVKIKKEIESHEDAVNMKYDAEWNNACNQIAKSIEEQ